MSKKLLRGEWLCVREHKNLSHAILETDRGSCYQSWDIWLLFYKLRQGLEAGLALWWSLNRQLLKSNKLEKSNPKFKQNQSDYKMCEGSECISDLSFVIYNHVKSAVMFQCFLQLHVPVHDCACYVSHACPLSDWSQIFYKKSEELKHLKWDF